MAERIGQLIGLEADPAPIEEAAWSTRRLLEALAAERPLVVVFDDLHWAEPTFLDLVEQLGEGGTRRPILLVAVARPELLEQRPAWAGGRPNAVEHAAGAAVGRTTRGRCSTAWPVAGRSPAQARERITRAAAGTRCSSRSCWRLAGRGGPAAPGGRRLGGGRRPGRLGDAPDHPGAGRRPPRPAGRPSTGTCWSGPRSSGRRSRATRSPSCRRRPPGARCRTGCAGWCGGSSLRTAPAQPAAEAGYQFRHLLVRDAVYAGVPQAGPGRPARAAGRLLEARAGAPGARVRGDRRLPPGAGLRCLAELGPVDRRGRELGARAAGRLATAGRRALARGDTPAATSLLARAVALLLGDHSRLALLLTDLADSLITTGDSAAVYQTSDRGAGRGRAGRCRPPCPCV